MLLLLHLVSLDTLQLRHELSFLKKASFGHLRIGYLVKQSIYTEKQKTEGEEDFSSSSAVGGEGIHGASSPLFRDSINHKAVMISALRIVWC